MSYLLDTNACIAIINETRLLSGFACVPCPALLRLAVLELIPMLLQDDAHQLTARADAGLGEELLQGSLHRTL